LQTAKRGDWKTTIDLLQKTIEKEPEPKRRKRTYGMHYIKYYPYLELGKAFLEIGDREEAYRFCEQAKRKGVAPKKKVEKCLTLVAPPTSAKERQEKLTELFQQGLIQAEHFNCAFEMLESDKSNPLLDGLLSGKITPEVFNRAFTCESQ
jgi:tetratricopeptide (TPR) repeat protein